MNKSKVNSISIDNFRVFKSKSEFEIAPITILTGANSSGKSSVIKALKLLQKFWQNLSEEGILDFSTGTHELGDYENVLPYNAEKEEITISYKLNKHILFGELCIENVFKPSDNQDVKNGVLKKSSLYQLSGKNKVVLYEVKYKLDSETQKETDIKDYYINTELILNTFIPKLKEIIKQREYFLEKCPRPHKSDRKDVVKNMIYKENFSGYIGDALCIEEENYNEEENEEASLFFVPIVNRELCNHLNMNYELWEDMEAHEGIPFLKGYERKIERKLFKTAKSFFQIQVASNKYNSRIFDLICLIPLDKYENFEEELWLLLNKVYSDNLLKIDKEKFHYLASSVEDQVIDIILEHTNQFSINLDLKDDANWKNLIRKYSETDFLTLFEKLERQEINNISHPIYADQLVNFSFKNNGIPTMESIIFHSILFYSALLDKKIFNIISNQNISTWNIESKIPLLSDIREEMERVSYTLVKATSDNMFFIDAIRANVQRIYTFSSQNTSFNHVLLKYLRQSRSSSEEEFMRKWIREFEIGDDIFFGKVSTIGADIKIQIKDRRVNLIDLGYGVTPFLALLINIVSSINEKAVSSRKKNDLKELSHSFRLVENTIVIEEPEVSLHPKLQSKLADFFWDAHKRFNVNFIIETHSEYLIRKFQYLTAKGSMETNDTILHYIDNPDVDKRRERELQIRTINIEPNGDLSSPFGKGFLDEADNLAMKLWSSYK